MKYLNRGEVHTQQNETRFTEINSISLLWPKYILIIKGNGKICMKGEIINYGRGVLSLVLLGYVYGFFKYNANRNSDTSNEV